MPALLFLFGFFFYVYCEISLLVAVGSAIGVLPLILLMIAISAAGMWLLKLRGVFTLLQIRQQVSQGQIPTQAVINSVFFALSGILLLIPGFLSDILAILLLLPWSRKGLQTLLMKYISSKFRIVEFSSPFQHHSAYQDPNTFDAEFERKQDEDKWIK